MPSTRTFSGIFRINGEIISDSVRAFLTDYEISLSDAKKEMFAREHLKLHPVSPKMFSHVWNIERMRNGFSYSISGTDVGAFTYGPLGHPGDNEHDYRPINCFVVSGKFTPTALSIKLEGVTLRGTSGLPNILKELEPWAFDIEFIIPRSEMTSFLQIQNSKCFEERVDAC
jgi:hypothetical protein